VTQETTQEVQIPPLGIQQTWDTKAETLLKFTAWRKMTTITSLKKMTFSQSKSWVGSVSPGAGSLLNDLGLFPATCSLSLSFILISLSPMLQKKQAQESTHKCCS
jgi:hypothetical protein